MRWIYRNFVRPVFFRWNPEDIHNLTLSSLGLVSQHRWLCQAVHSVLGAPELPVSLCGMNFPNPIGLAAGMDKDGAALLAWEAMGFGFNELGAVTWLAQPGNDKPRVFRGIRSQSIVNRMGFNNSGAEAMAQKLETCRKNGIWPRHPVGVNIGKNKVTPLEKAPEDYASTLRVLLPQADFFVINVSSPNTPNLRLLQDKAALEEIIVAMQEVNNQWAARNQKGSAGAKGKPIFVKVAPDLTWEALDEIVGLIEARGLAGIVATNTTLSRPATDDPVLTRVYGEKGGLSGVPLRARSTEVIAHLYRQTSGKVPIIGVGGVFNADDAWEKIIMGASLVQVYTGMVYEGPSVVQSIVKGLQQKLKENGISKVSDAVGIGIKKV